ncbi:hypothetical protein RRG08_043019 [Elysia crispata]|uniref:Uncharacterized protein n=1 Tax=Elysia crispata TaxID=231223 RepID=A0AAE1CPQ8_9GAST|nr:hypothetical protein RRG08_043019 [Elysia crispata]
MPARLRAIHFSIILARQSQSKAQPLPGRRAKEATLTTKDLIYPRCTDLKLGDTRDGYLGLHWKLGLSDQETTLKLIRSLYYTCYYVLYG